MDFRLISNHVQVIKTVEDFEAGMTRLAATISREGAALVAERARAIGHVVTGRTVGSIELQPLNQYATRVVGGFGAVWEERRGGDHALFTNATTDIEPQALQRFEQLGLEAVRSIGG